MVSADTVISKTDINKQFDQTLRWVRLAIPHLHDTL